MSLLTLFLWHRHWSRWGEWQCCSPYHPALLCWLCGSGPHIVRISAWSLPTFKAVLTTVTLIFVLAASASSCSLSVGKKAWANHTIIIITSILFLVSFLSSISVSLNSFIVSTSYVSLLGVFCVLAVMVAADGSCPSTAAPWLKVLTTHSEPFLFELLLSLPLQTSGFFCLRNENVLAKCGIIQVACKLVFNIIT